MQGVETVFLCLHGHFSESEAGEMAVPDDMPGVKGIFIGGCVISGIGSRLHPVKHPSAHAHIGGVWKGWVCFQLPEYFTEPEYHWLRMHELAHIISGQGHTEKWRKVMRDLGQEITDQYKPRRRRKKVQ